MAKKITPTNAIPATPARPAVSAAPASSTPVRNSAIPPRPTTQPQTGRRVTPSYDQIAKRAYEIWQSGKGGSQDDNWYRAERELRGS